MPENNDIRMGGWRDLDHPHTQIAPQVTENTFAPTAPIPPNAIVCDVRNTPHLSAFGPRKRDGIGQWIEHKRLIAKSSKKPHPKAQDLNGIVVIPVVLTKGFHALVSESDYDRVSKIHWRARVHADGRAYAVAHMPGSGNRGKDLNMHGFIMGAAKGQRIDHKDGDGLHNWRENLRLASNAQNTRNQKPHITGKFTSKFKGIYRMKCGRYRAQIMCQYRKINLGTFADEMEAARAYDENARKLHGEFARLNFPSSSGGAR